MRPSTGIHGVRVVEFISFESLVKWAPRRGTRSVEHDLTQEEEKLKKRKCDETISPTAFLWASYFPNRYYYEVCTAGVEVIALHGVVALPAIFLPFAKAPFDESAGS